MLDSILRTPEVALLGVLVFITACRPTGGDDESDTLGDATSEGSSQSEGASAGTSESTSSATSESETGVPSSSEACIAANLPADTHGFESDNEDECPQPFDGGEEPCPPVTPESVAQECSEAGQVCDPAAFITRDAAICIAELEGLEPGLAPWTVSLVFNYDVLRPIWAVDNLLDDDECVPGGRSLVIDAETGALLDMLLWQAQLC